MKRVLLVDYSKNFIDNIQRYLLINEHSELMITTIEDINQVSSYLASQQFDLIVVFAGYLESIELNFNIPIRSYARKEEEIELSERYKISCYGVVTKSQTLIEDILNDDLVSKNSSFEDAERSTRTLKADDIPEQFKDGSWNTGYTEQPQQSMQEVKKTVPSYGEQTDNDMVFEQQTQSYNQSANAQYNILQQQQAFQYQQQQYQQQTQQQYQPQAQSQMQQPVQQQSVKVEQDDFDDLFDFDNLQTDESFEDILDSGQSTQTQNEQNIQTGQQSYQSQNYQQNYQQNQQFQQDYQQQQMTQSFQAPVPAVQQPQYSYYPSVQGQQPSFIDNYGRAIYEVLSFNNFSQGNTYSPAVVSDQTNQNNIQQNNSYVQSANQAVAQNGYNQGNQSNFVQSNRKDYNQGNAFANRESLKNQEKNQEKKQAKEKISLKSKKQKKTDTFSDGQGGYDKNIGNFEEDKLNTSQKLQYKATDRFKQAEKQQQLEAQHLAIEKLEEDLGNVKHDAKCITVYSAKGGVGKTTIACELATFLALTSHNRSKYKVCIADFNIDFGDVMNTLAFDQSGANMTTWAEDIKMRIQNGERPENINYSQEDIQVWLQRKTQTGLYALLAPSSNVDSMNIAPDEIRVMVDNLVKNGGFDFVICDTGNNTRDSSYIALEKADTVLLVLTQDVNTANCNQSFIHTAENLDFDMDKIKLVINQVRPTKIVGISPEELETALIDSRTRKAYRFETYAKVKHSNDVVSCGNKGEPIVYNSSHEVTHAIGGIVSKLTGQENVLTTNKKESFFDRIFKK